MEKLKQEIQEWLNSDCVSLGSFLISKHGSYENLADACNIPVSQIDEKIMEILD